MPNNKSKLWILLGVLVVIVIIIIVAASQGKKKVDSGPNGESMPAGTEQTGNTPETGNTPSTTGTGTVEEVVDMRNAAVQIPGASLVTSDNKVVTPEGKVAKNDAIPASQDAPKSVLIAKDQLPKQAINIEVNNGKFSPSSFSVKPNQPVNFAITSADGQVHVVIFSNSVLGAIAMGIGPGETKAITFNAPAAAGEYEFRCDVPGHRDKGEVGKMIVK
ncbi:MAG: cupredoxin domain-containing protein [Patescibacteria group bacterium]